MPDPLIAAFSDPPDLAAHFGARERYPRGQSRCDCCEGSGSHGRDKCRRCRGLGHVKEGSAEPWCEESEAPRPRRRHWRESERTASDTGYRQSHEAPGDDDYGDRLHEVGTKPGGGIYPPDALKRPHDYGAFHSETADKVRRASGKPDHKVWVYRSMPSPHREINTGDWVATAAEYARQHGRESSAADDWPVIKFQARADQLSSVGDMEEWGYHGPPVKRGLVHFRGGRNQQGGVPRGKTDAMCHEHEPQEMQEHYGRITNERVKRRGDEREAQGLPRYRTRSQGARQPYVVYHGAHHDDVPSILREGLRPGIRGATVTDSREGASLIAHMRDWTDPRVVEIHVPHAERDAYLGAGQDGPEGTAHELRRQLPASWVAQVHTAAYDAPPREYSAGRMLVADIRIPGEGRLSERPYTQRELAADIRRNGVQQPVAVEHLPAHGGPTSFNGMHRLDAARRAGVADVPVVVKHLPGQPPPMTGRRAASEQEFNDAFDLEREGRWAGQHEAARILHLPLHMVSEMGSEYGQDEHGRRITMADIGKYSPERMADERYAPADLRAMTESVRRGGVRKALDVETTSDGDRGIVLDGTHRYWAAAQAGRSHVPVRFHGPDPDRARAHYQQRIENEEQRPGSARTGSAEGPWYHGTTDEYAPGDQIEHHYWKKYPDRPDFRQHSPLYVTGNPSLAAHIADLRERQSGRRVPGRMYEVRPSGSLSPDEIAAPIVRNRDSWQATSPLHVIREVPRGEWPQDLSAWRVTQQHEGRRLPDWLEETFEHARSSLASLPAWARPVVTHPAPRLSSRSDDHPPLSPQRHDQGRVSGSAGSEHRSGSGHPPVTGAPRIKVPLEGGHNWEENLRLLRHRKRSEPLMHRGIAVELPPEVHSFVHDQFQDRDRQARAIAEHLRGRPLGMHWSAGEKTPRHFADFEKKKSLPGSTKVILHAALPEVDHIETDREKLAEGGVLGYGAMGSSEYEIPVKAGAPVRIKGITWYGYGNRKRSGNLYDHVHEASLRTAAVPEYGLRPEFRMAPEDWDDERRSAYHEQQFGAERAWRRSMRNGLSMGHLTNEQALGLGYHGRGHDQSSYHAGPAWKPLPHDLYHVTTDMEGVRRHGLLAPDERENFRPTGLGGSEDDSVSLTSSHERARGILRAMREYHHALHSDPHELWERAQRGDQGSEPFHRDLARYHDRDWEPGQELPRELSDQLNGTRHEHGMATREEKPGWTPLDEGMKTPRGHYHFGWERPATDEEKLHQRSDLFKHFVAYRGWAGGPENPTFMGNDPKAFSKLDPSNFGIVHLHPHPGAQGYHLPAEDEYRITTGKAVYPHHWQHEAASRKIAASSAPHPGRLQGGSCREYCTYGGTHCAVCHEPVKINLHKTEVNGGWHHHDSIKRDHPAVPADPQGVIDSIPGQLASRDQVRAEVADTFHRQLEEYGGRPLPRRGDDQLPPDPFTHEGARVPSSGASFYRGGRQEYQPGDLISPQDSTHVYATSHAANAKMYGPHVYEVEFTGPHEPDPEYLGNGAFRRSVHPVRVIRDATEHATAEVGARHFGAWVPSSGVFGPTTGLDPQLFTEAQQLRPQVREAILERLAVSLHQLLGEGWQSLVRVYLAGGSASEWAGARPGEQGARDLDVLIGPQDPQGLARETGHDGVAGSGPHAVGEGEQVAQVINRVLRAHFNDEHWLPGFGGSWSLTGYYNPHAGDITAIHPYAAWDLTNSRWAVKPPHLPHHSVADFDPAVIRHARAMATEARAILQLPEPFRHQQARDLWDRLHAARSRAFSDEGAGWQDPGNLAEKWLAYSPRNILGRIKELAHGAAGPA